MQPTHNRYRRAKASVGRSLLCILLTIFFAVGSPAQNQAVPDVSKMSLEDLMNVEVTSVSKHTQRVADAAAAIFVITQEDIRRSGAANIPEALRMVPGIQVARIDENKWAISSRGFNGRFDNKLLVLIDGRSVYTPLFSGVYWNIQDVMLEDVDRIEVIRGPGATLWGANAVDGVINIITKPAKATQGGIVTAEAGTEERGSESARYGGQLGKSVDYRVYEKYFDWAPSIDATGKTANDGWDEVRGGFRIDTQSSGPNALTVQGDLYRSNYNETLTIPSLSSPYSSTFPNGGDYSGGNILGRWNHNFSGSSTSLQVYFDQTNVVDDSLFTDHESVYDIDFQHNIHLSESQELVWGLGYRSIQDTNGSSSTVALLPNHSSLNQFSSFLQDEISFFDRRLSVTIGSKFEHNDFTGFEVQPNIRLLGNISKDQSVWVAVSRAVRTPALTEEGLRLNEGVVPPGAAPFFSPLPVTEAIFGSNQFQSEDLLAYEAGYRVQATKSLSLDIAAFYNSYSNLRSAEPGTPFLEGSPAPTDVVFPFVASNKMGGGTYGVEPFVEWKVLPKWQLLGSYSYLQMDIRKNANSLDPTADNPDGESPRHQFYVRSSIDLPKHFEQDLSLRYVDKLSSLNIPSYYSLDFHLGWRPSTHLELALVGQDLLNSQHLEFIPEFINTTPTEVRRTFSGHITWRF
ncbi:MAG TPA: TonB-dependent receptor plug domain-containing protein [Candidatus Acidoferrum sp.]|jgi:iron complex outermembrane receptor protein